MGALADIQRQIDGVIATAERKAGHPITQTAKRLARAHRMKVLVELSAERAILAETGDGSLPECIDDVPVERTDAFEGWEVEIL